MERQKRLFKIGTSTFIWFLALIFAFIKGSYHWWFVVGMTACWLGDMTLSRYEPISNWTRNPFIGGMSMFFIGHLCYAIGLISGTANVSMSGWGFIVWLIIFWAVEALLFMTVIWPKRSVAPPVKVASAAYIALVCLTAALCLALSIKHGRLWPLAVGGLLFVLSDTIIGARDVGEMRIPGGDIIVWGTYAPAQLLLIIGSLLLG